MARSSTKGDGAKIKGETPKKAPKLPAGADAPTHYAEQRGSGGETRQATSDAAARRRAGRAFPSPMGRTA